MAGVFVAFGLGISGNDVVVGAASAQVVTEVPSDPNVAHAYHAAPIPATSGQTPAPTHRVIEVPRRPWHRFPGTEQHGIRPGHAAISSGAPYEQSYEFSHHGDMVVPAPNEGLSTGPSPRHHPGSAKLADTVRVPGASTPFSEWAGGVGSRLIPRPPLSSLLQRVPAAAATIPDARQTTVWKRPYSYGYFGASGKRHWTKHHSYRDNDTRWTLR